MFEKTTRFNPKRLLTKIFPPAKKVLVVSHERSGTHFLINTIAMNFPIYHDQEISIEGERISNPSEKEKERIKFTTIEQFNKYYGKKSKKIFKSHHQVEFFKENINEFCREFEVFYIFRDGRDVLTSQYHFFLNDNHPAPKPYPHVTDFSEYLRLNPSDFPHDAPYSYISSSNYVSRWAKHVSGWLNLKDNITIIRYEDLKNNFSKVIPHISTAINIPPSRVIAEPKLNESRSIFPRKGVIGDWENMFSKKDLDFFYDNADDTLDMISELYPE